MQKEINRKYANITLKIVCITGSNKWSDVMIKNWCMLHWSLEVKTYLVL
jgi:hypothetical protein